MRKISTNDDKSYIEKIENIILSRGEGLLGDDGVDENVASEIAKEILNEIKPAMTKEIESKILDLMETAKFNLLERVMGDGSSKITPEKLHIKIANKDWWATDYANIHAESAVLNMGLSLLPGNKKAEALAAYSYTLP